MREISFKEWTDRFELLDAENDVLDADSAQEYRFFDNGAVQQAGGDFVIKYDAVKPRQ